MAQGNRRSWSHIHRANIWTTYGTVLSIYFGFGLLLRVVFRSHQHDYLGFWGWFLLLSLAGAGYGFVRERQDAAPGIAPRPTSPTENVLAGVLAVGTTLIIWLTDDTAARMPGRYLVAFLVLALIAVDCVIRYRRHQSDLAADLRGRGW